jgi:tRNA pseudouridine synthase 10
MIIMSDVKLEPKSKDKALKIIKITDGKICNRCLGRNFFKEIEAADNKERGSYIKDLLIQDIYESQKNQKGAYESQKTEKADELQETQKYNRETKTTCYVCGDLFELVENGLIDKIIQNIKEMKVEFSTFLVGCRVQPEIIQKEENIHNEVKFSVEEVKEEEAKESVKKELNREIGKRLALQMEKEVDFDNPNLVIVVDFVQDNVEIQINPLFIEGRYRKLIRGIPQTRWPCRKCKGKGCENCNYTGKMYQESVEELISPEAVKLTHGSESKFHGAGREDIDVRMLGRGRPFVLEIKEPLQRNPDLEKLQVIINQHAKGKVEVLDLKMVGKERRSQIKTSSTDTYKTYQAVVELETDVSIDDLSSLNSLKAIDQRTPLRVSHRRADKIRKRKVRSINVKKLDQRFIELIIECEGGLYIKELISGDENRTQPNVSSILNTNARCVQLDVLEVYI